MRYASSVSTMSQSNNSSNMINSSANSANSGSVGKDHLITPKSESLAAFAFGGIVDDQIEWTSPPQETRLLQMNSRSNSLTLRRQQSDDTPEYHGEPTQQQIHNQQQQFQREEEEEQEQQQQQQQERKEWLHSAALRAMSASISAHDMNALREGTAASASTTTTNNAIADSSIPIHGEHSMGVPIPSSSSSTYLSHTSHPPYPSHGATPTWTNAPDPFHSPPTRANMNANKLDWDTTNHLGFVRELPGEAEPEFDAEAETETTNTNQARSTLTHSYSMPVSHGIHNIQGFDSPFRATGGLSDYLAHGSAMKSSFGSEQQHQQHAQRPQQPQFQQQQLFNSGIDAAYNQRLNLTSSRQAFLQQQQQQQQQFQQQPANNPSNNYQQSPQDARRDAGRDIFQPSNDFWRNDNLLRSPPQSRQASPSPQVSPDKSILRSIQDALPNLDDGPSLASHFRADAMDDPNADIRRRQSAQQQVRFQPSNSVLSAPMRRNLTRSLSLSQPGNHLDFLEEGIAEAFGSGEEANMVAAKVALAPHLLHRHSDTTGGVLYRTYSASQAFPESMQKSPPREAMQSGMNGPMNSSLGPDLSENIALIDLGRPSWSENAGPRPGSFSSLNSSTHGGTQKSALGMHPGETPKLGYPYLVSRTVRARKPVLGSIPYDVVRREFERFGPIRMFLYKPSENGESRMVRQLDPDRISEYPTVSYFDLRHASQAAKVLAHLGLQFLSLPEEAHLLNMYQNTPLLVSNPSLSSQSSLSTGDCNQGTIVVFNIDPGMSLDVLWNLFGAHGEVKEIRETAHKRNHKFVEYYDIRDAEKAIRNLNKTEFNGKRLKIEISRYSGSGGSNRNSANNYNNGAAGASSTSSSRQFSPPAAGNMDMSHRAFSTRLASDSFALSSSRSDFHRCHSELPRSESLEATSIVSWERSPQQTFGIGTSPPTSPPMSYLTKALGVSPFSSPNMTGPEGLASNSANGGGLGTNLAPCINDLMGKSSQESFGSPDLDGGMQHSSLHRSMSLGMASFSGSSHSYGQSSQIGGSLSDIMAGGGGSGFKSGSSILSSSGHLNPYSGSNSSNTKFVLIPKKVLSGEDLRTTLMIRNIPNKYTQRMLLATFEENHRGRFDFFYLPIDFKNRCNVGYAFINFIRPEYIVPFYEQFHAHKWGKFNSEKVCEISYARIQGKNAMVTHFQNSSLMNEDPKCRPVLFNDNGEQEEFPVGAHVRTRRGPSVRESSVG